ncbi:hypothetical protein TorRG33x02_118340 [Trema orientale]|uniref:Uncharacterized protein n=1 Tax=Trema orientale TaxID=63057 RepID=A0A2P5F3L1_TREOI|nr:hypothetical protein TorRG33x02_118340 [Trema orientale]
MYKITRSSIRGLSKASSFEEGAKSSKNRAKKKLRFRAFFVNEDYVGVLDNWARKTERDLLSTQKRN